MDSITASKLPLAATTDVLVCGGGTAGAVAAIAAARAGAKVLIVEQLGLLGGTQSAAWVTPMMPNKILEESLTHGINDEIIHRADNTHGARSWRISHPHPVFSPDGKRIYFN